MIKLICKKANGDVYDLSKSVQKVTWSGDYKSCSRKLEFTLVNSIDIPLSSMIIFYENDVELFSGFVWKRGLDSGSNTTDYLAYDYGERLNKIKVSYNIKNKTANEIVNTVCADYGLNKGNIVTGTTKINKVFLGTNIYEMLMTAYTEQSKVDNKKYMIYYKGDKLYASEKGIIKLKVKFEEGKNINSTRFEESIENMINKVVIVDENGNKKSEVKDDEMLKIHGLFQDIYKEEEDKDSISAAKSMLNGVEQSCSLSGFGDTTCITGFGVEIKDTRTSLNGLFYIDSDKHNWEGGKYSIDLDLSFKNIMNEVSAGQDENETSTSEGITSDSGSSSSVGGSSSGKGQDIVDAAKTKLGCKYVWGATGPNTFDCSGLTGWAHKQCGISIPRVSKDQGKGGKSVTKSNLQIGDLVFFNNPISHVGIYCGNGQYIHAPKPGDVVKISNLSSMKNYNCARRYY